MLRSFVDLASRATRLDLLKPRFYGNEFLNVQTNPDGMIAVHNARYKTRIRVSKQVRNTRQYMVVPSLSDALSRLIWNSA
jgi:hypothetical protein